MFESLDANGYTATCAAIRDMDLRNIAGINTVRTLIIAGSQDLATPVSDSIYLQNQYSDAKLVEIDAGHISNIEKAELFNKNVLDFLL